MKNRLDQAGAWLFTLMVATVARWDGGDDPDRDRGDVPGWVMITVMSAILVVVILGVFKGQVQTALTGIFDKINSAG